MEESKKKHRSVKGKRRRENQGENREDGWKAEKTLDLSLLLQTYLCEFFFFIMFADTPECPETQTFSIYQQTGGAFKDTVISEVSESTAKQEMF